MNQVPGCYSVPSVLSFDSPVCQACRFLALCQKEAKAKLLSIKEPSILLSRLLRIHENFERGNEPKKTSEKTETRFVTKWEPDECQSAVISRMPVAASRYYKTLLKSGIEKEVQEALVTGRNPFSEFGQRGAHIAVEHMKEAGGFNRVSLTKVIQEKLGWTRNSAGAHAAILWHCFLALGLAAEVPGQDWAISMYPSTYEDNERSDVQEVA